MRNFVPGIWNQLRALEFGIQYLDSGIHRVESRTHDCLEFSYMGQNIFSLYSKIVLRRAQPQLKT